MLVRFNWPGLCWLSEKLVQRTATKAIHLRSCTAHLAFVNTAARRCSVRPQLREAASCLFLLQAPALGPAWPPPFPAAPLFRAPRGAPGCLGSSSWEQQVCREAWRVPRLRDDLSLPEVAQLSRSPEEAVARKEDTRSRSIQNWREQVHRPC